MKKFAFAAALVALAACSTVGPAPPTERPVVEATACPDLDVKIYFDPTVTTVPASADPVFATINETIATCKARFSHVRRVDVAAFGANTADGATGAANAAARAQAVKAKVISALGVSARKVKIVEHDAVDDDADQPLRRHAHVIVKFNVER
ncbi:MAG: hypothetical protein SGJ23_07395 [Alphaproteobacteria bacterium]|nr:hypothetical protein [Alphaproteobacteria bacterium]